MLSECKGFRCLCGEPRRATFLKGQRSANTIHLPNILRFTIAMVVVLSQTDQNKAAQMECGDEPGANLAKGSRKNGRLLVLIGIV
jgi:hypothetical protein